MDMAHARRILDRHLLRFRPVNEWRSHSRGWIRTLRTALGMTTAQLAARMGVSRPRITILEQAEARGTVTMASLEKAAEALDCTLVYALVPRIPLEQMVVARAREKATAMVACVDRTMLLEAPNLGADSLAEQREELVAEILRGNPRRLWDDVP